MISLTNFYLKRRFLSPVTIFLNILYFIIIFGLFHFDFLFGMPINNEVSLDKSAIAFFSYFENLNKGYQFEQKDCAITIYYKDHFIIESNSKDVEDIKNDIVTVIYQKGLEDGKISADCLTEIENIEIKNEQENSFLWTVLTIVFLLIMNYSTMLSDELAQEKNSRILETILTNISIEKHFIVKLITGYLTPLIQCGLILIIFIINFVIRNFQDNFNGLIIYLERNINDSSISFDFNFLILLKIFFLLFLGLFIIQLILMLITCFLKNEQECYNLKSIVMILTFVAYCLMTLYFDNSFFLTDMAYYLSLLPITSMVVMSVCLLLNNVTANQFMICLLINSISVILLLVITAKTYKRKIIS